MADVSKKQEKPEETEDLEPVPNPGCGILGRYPVLAVLTFAVIGIGMGVGFSFWEPEDPDTKSKLLKWLGLIGDLFIRALKCVVLPLVFINVVISIMDMMSKFRVCATANKEFFPASLSHTSPLLSYLQPSERLDPSDGRRLDCTWPLR